jgi:peptide/nickel transport system substrate-binding protein
MTGKNVIRFEDVCNSYPYGIIILDLEGKIVMFNSISEKMLGIQRKEVEQKFYRDAFASFQEIITAIEKEEHKQELFFDREDQHLQMEVDYSTIRNDKDRKLGAILTLKDVTDRKKVDDQIQRIGRLASLGQLVASIAHEVRNPLSGVVYILDELHDHHQRDKEQREIIEKALREIDRLDQMISGLLDFARVDRFHLSSHDINVILDDALLWVKKRCDKLGVRVLKDYGHDLPKIMLEPEKIKQAFLNLIMNAIDASGQTRTIKIKTRGCSGREKRRLHEGKFIEVIVEDSGPGIPVQNQRKIFDPFFTTKPNGSGLGLSIAHGIIAEHGGKITVDSEEGRGSRIITYLPTSSHRKGGILRVGIESRIDALDPHSYGGWMTYRVLHNIFDGLVDRDLTSSKAPHAPIAPGLAKSWLISPDGRTYTFHLRDGVRFHDGTLFDADAVKFNIDRMANPNAPQYDSKSARYSIFIWRYLKGVQVLDPFRVRIHLRETFSDFLAQMTEGGIGSAKMLSPAAWQKYGNSGIKDHPVGTGPFKFLEKGKNGDIVLERNFDYWGKKPFLDRLIFKPIPDSATRVASLQTGEVDFIFVPPPDTINILKKSGFKVVLGPTPHIWFMCLNMQNRKMQDPRVRKAINLAIDKEGMARQLLHGMAQPAYGLQTPGCPSYDPDFIDYEYDPQAARRLLSEAGYPKGLKIRFQTSTAGSGQLIPVSMAEWIRRDLEKVGIDCRLDLREWVKYIGLWATGMRRGVEANQISWGMSSDYWLEVVAHSKNWGPEGRNTGYYANPKVDQLLDLARAEHVQRRKTSLLKKANALITQDAAFVPIVNDLAPICMSEKVKGFVHAPAEWYDFKTVWVED